jgi:hypothetical protein
MKGQLGGCISGEQLSQLAASFSSLERHRIKQLCRPWGGRSCGRSPQLLEVNRSLLDVHHVALPLTKMPPLEQFNTVPKWSLARNRRPFIQIRSEVGSGQVLGLVVRQAEHN